jgi:hypothetical protein
MSDKNTGGPAMTPEIKKALKLALEVLEVCEQDGYIPVRLTRDALTAIKQARSAPVQEQRPYAYANPNDLCADTAFRWCEIGEFTMPVYTTPPAAREWVGLTVNERGKVYADWRWSDGRTSNLALCEAIETKLREKNTGVSKPRESP